MGLKDWGSLTPLAANTTALVELPADLRNESMLIMDFKNKRQILLSFLVLFYFTYKYFASPLVFLRISHPARGQRITEPSTAFINEMLETEGNTKKGVLSVRSSVGRESHLFFS